MSLESMLNEVADRYQKSALYRQSHAVSTVQVALARMEEGDTANALYILRECERLEAQYQQYLRDAADGNDDRR